MYVQQLTVTLDNKACTMADVADMLARHCINIRALAMTEQNGHGFLRIIVNDTEKAKKLFSEKQYPCLTQDVLVIEVPDKPGGLASVLDSIKKLDLTVEFLSAFTQRSGERGLIILRFNDLVAALAALKKAGVRVLSSEELYAK